MFRDAVSAEPRPRRPAKRSQQLRIDDPLKIETWDPFPGQLRLLLEDLEKLSRMLSSRWLPGSWRRIKRPDPHDILIEALRVRRRLWEYPVQVDGAAGRLFRRSAIGSGCGSEFSSDFSSAFRSNALILLVKHIRKIYRIWMNCS